MEPDELVATAIAASAEVVRGVRPDQLSAPTPCDDWEVRALVNHLLQVAHAVELAGRGQPIGGEVWQSERIGGDWAGSLERALGAWAGSPGDGPVDFGGGPMPRPYVATMLASDLIIHGWDLARATGQELHCPEDAARLTHAFIAETAEQGRSMKLYAEPVAVPDNASLMDQALALSGRDPRWTR
jgi:uncharacterized protein (TIGR03086 family)